MATPTTRQGVNRYADLIEEWERTDADDAQRLRVIGDGLAGAVEALAADLAELQGGRP